MFYICIAKFIHMKTNLSSQIKLDQIPKRYYAPEGEIELAELTREEKVYTRIFETAVDGSDYIAHKIVDTINPFCICAPYRVLPVRRSEFPKCNRI